jgi:GH24 family phage-related lysozyme (muramidase)
MARNNWARDAFRKAQNLMSRGYGDFQPKTVVTRDQLSDLSDVITTSRPRTEGPRTERQLDTNMRSPFSGNPWNLDNEIATTNAYVEEEGPVDINNQPLNTDNFDIEAPYGPLDPQDHPKKPEATSRLSRLLNKYINEPLGELNKWLNSDTEETRTTEKFDKALEKIEDEITETYTVFDKKTPTEQKKEKEKVFELEQDRRRILEQKEAWEKGNDLPYYGEGKQTYIKTKPKLKKLEKAIGEGGKIAWNENKSKLDPNLVEMIEDTIPELLGDAKDYVNDFNPEATKEWLKTKYKQATAPDLEQDDEASQYIDFLKDKEGFEPEAYNNFNEKYDTIGYGHYGPDVRKGIVLNERQAENLLKQDIEERLPQIKKAIPKFDSLPMEVKQHIVGSWFRGSLSGSPKTIKLINAGLFARAADEFLDNNDYRTTENRGVKKRMKATADALRSLEGR